MTDFKPTFRPRLVAQEPERENGKLFDLDRGEFIDEPPPCDHFGTAFDYQKRLDGNHDVLCGACGARLASCGWN